MNNIPKVEELNTYGILLYKKEILQMESLEENLLDEVCRNTKNCPTTEIQQSYMLCEQI